MHAYPRQAMVGLLVLVALGVVVGVGSASRGIGEAPARERFSLTTERLVFQAEGGIRVTCPVTLSGSLAGGVEKVAGRSAAEITSASLTEGSCSGGSARLLTETLPWDLNYYAFAGTLPAISSLTLGIERLSALIEVIGLRCLYAGLPRGITNSGSSVTSIRLDETVRVPLARENAFCPTTGTLSGSLSVSPTVRLTLLTSLGSVLVPNPTTLTIPNTDASGRDRLRAEGGFVVIHSILAREDNGRLPFSATGCGPGTVINAGTTCEVTVTPTGGRPTSGNVIVTYYNDQVIRMQTSFAVVIN